MAMNSDFSREKPSHPETPVFHQQRYGMSRQIIASTPNITGHPSNEYHGRSFLVDFFKCTYLEKQIKSGL